MSQKEHCDPPAAAQIRSFVERIERLEEEKKSTADDIKEVYAEAKGAGFETKTLRKVVAARRMKESDRAEQMELFDLYMEALGHA